MSINIKDYANLATLQTFLDNIRNSFATKDEFKNKADISHTHDIDIDDITDLRTTLDAKADLAHSHDVYATKQEVEDAIAISDTYIDEVAATKSLVQIITWEADD